MTEFPSLSQLLTQLSPVLHEGVYVFATIPRDSPLTHINPIATFRESESTTVILEESRALELGISIHFRAAWITLEVYSDLAAVGLTAAVSTALAEANISCNLIAATHHDHLFVPVENGERALKILRRLQADAIASAWPKL
jgi:uncharacterized protein